MQRLRDWDLAVFRVFNISLHRDWLDPLFTVLAYSGLGISVAVICIAMLLWKPTRNLAWPVGLASALSGFVLADGLKKLIARDRPSNFAWANVQEPIYYSSFPSGHTATTFGFAAMLLFLLYRSDFRWAGWLVIVWAALVGVSRMYRGVHYPSDVLGGALCGFTAAAILYLIFERKGLLPEFQSDEAEPETTD